MGDLGEKFERVEYNVIEFESCVFSGFDEVKYNVVELDFRFIRL